MQCVINDDQFCRESIVGARILVFDDLGGLTDGVRCESKCIKKVDESITW